MGRGERMVPTSWVEIRSEGECELSARAGGKERVYCAADGRDGPPWGSGDGRVCSA